MKLSEALRIGITKYPKQAFGIFHLGDASCANGAITDGLIISGEFAAFQRLNIKQPTCPGCGPTCTDVYSGLALQGMIWHLNDDVRWTREQIADWLESIHE